LCCKRSSSVPGIEQVATPSDGTGKRAHPHDVIVDLYGPGTTFPGDDPGALGNEGSVTRLVDERPGKARLIPAIQIDDQVDFDSTSPRRGLQNVKGDAIVLCGGVQVRANIPTFRRSRKAFA
jgi:hypothetical protein